jgi:predicted metal-dependent peptidase
MYREYIEKKIVRARTSLVLDHPFFASLALRLVLKEDRHCETAWTDGRVLAYNPDYAQLLPMDELTGLCAHIVMHPACGHHKHRKGRDPNLWNRACDYAINWILLEAGITLPEGYLDHPRYRHKSADEIYHLLQQREGASAARTAASGIAGGEGMRTDSKGKAQTSTSVRQSAGVAGDSADDDSSEREEIELNEYTSTGDPGKAGEVRDSQAEAGNESWQPEDEPDWQIAISQAANHAKSIGKLPGVLERLVHDILEPKVDWRVLLARFIDNAARNDYAWMPPNRRHIHDGIYLPALNNMELNELVIALDTSGSISPEELNLLGTELSAILENNPARIHLLYCDVAVVDWLSISREELPLKIEPKGGGGTDFRPAFEWVERQGVRPACFIYLSDMRCDKFPQEPDFPVLWGRLGEGGKQPPFGELLEVHTGI